MLIALLRLALLLLLLILPITGFVATLLAPLRLLLARVRSSLASGLLRTLSRLLAVRLLVFAGLALVAFPTCRTVLRLVPHLLVGLPALLPIGSLPFLPPPLPTIRVLLLVLASLALIAVIRITRLAIALARRLLLRRRRGVDLESLPVGDRAIRLVGPGIGRDRPVLENAPRTTAKFRRNQRFGTAEVHAAVTDEQFATAAGIAAREPRLDAHARQAEVGIQGFDPHGHRSIGRNGQNLLCRHFDLHFRREIRNHLDPVLEPACQIVR